MAELRDPRASNPWELRKFLLGFLQKNGVPQETAEQVLSQCAAALRDARLVETVARTAGYDVRNYRCDDGLELYYDVTQHGLDVGYISKGWVDPGFRLGDLLIFSGDTLVTFRERSDEVIRVCSAQLTAVGAKLEGDDLGFDITIPIYEGGLNAQTFDAAFRHLALCASRVRDTLLG